MKEARIMENKAFFVGFGRRDITPQEVGIPLNGDLKLRDSTGVQDPIYATCVAMKDAAGTELLMYHIDLQNLMPQISYPIIGRIAERTGVPKENITVTCTHMHRGPYNQHRSNAMIDRYNVLLNDQMIAAGVEALEDLKPARMYTAHTHVENGAFVRHYIQADGGYCGDQWAYSDAPVVGHAREADVHMQLVKFVREGGKDVVMMNWTGHVHYDGIKKTTISADYVGAVRDYLEKETGCLFAFYQGAAGDQNPRSRIPEENRRADYIGYGQRLGEHAQAAAYQEVDSANIQVLKQTYEVEPELNMWAITVGDVAFITAPYEMFSATGKYIKQESPFPTTFVISYTNGYVGYMPNKEAYEFRQPDGTVMACYETNCCNYVKGTAEILADKYVEMLKSLYPTRK